MVKSPRRDTGHKRALFAQSRSTKSQSLLKGTLQRETSKKDIERQKSKKSLSREPSKVDVSDPKKLSTRTSLPSMPKLDTRQASEKELSAEEQAPAGPRHLSTSSESLSQNPLHIDLDAPTRNLIRTQNWETTVQKWGYSDKISKLIGELHDRNLIESKPLGSGAISTVYLNTYHTQKGPVQVVVKKEAELPPDTDQASFLGINTKAPKTPQRNLAFQQFSEKLGLGLAVETHVGVFQATLATMMSLAEGEPGTGAAKMERSLLGATDAENNQLELLDMTFRELGEDNFLDTANQMGLTAVQIEKDEAGNIRFDENNKLMISHEVHVSAQKPLADPKDPALVNKLNQLQILDTLLRQCDRHPGNYFVLVGENGEFEGITGIDNDFSLSQEKLTPSSLVFSDIEDADGNLVKRNYSNAALLPIDVDEATMAAFESLTDEAIASILQGLDFEQEVVDATVFMHNEIKKHFTEVREGKFEGQEPTETNSYAKRFETLYNKNKARNIIPVPTTPARPRAKSSPLMRRVFLQKTSSSPI